MAQIPLEETNTSMVQVPITEEGTSNELHQRGVSNVLVAKDNNRDPVEAYIEAVQSNDLLEMQNTWNRTTTDDRLNIIQSQLQVMPPEQVQQEVNDLADNISSPSIQGNYIETIKSLPSSIGKSEEQITREAVHMQMREVLAEHAPRLGDMEFGEIASNIGGVLIPKRRAVAFQTLLSDMGFVGGFTETVDVLVDPTDEIMKLRNMFWDLDDEGQIQFMDLLAEHLPNSSDNAIIRGELAQNILGGEFNDAASTVFEGLDNLDITLVANAIGTLGKSLANTGKILNYARRNDPDLAADLIQDAIKNPEAAAKVGITQADIADAVNPLIHGEVGNILTGAPDDVSASVRHTMDIQDARFKAITDDIARHGILDKDGMDDAMKAAEIKQMEQPGVIEANVNQFDETGFTLDWTEAYFDSIGRLRKKKAKRTVDFTVNDQGEIRAPLSDWVNKGLTTLDPNARMKGILRKWFVSDVESLARKQEMTAKAFDKMMEDAFTIRASSLRGLKKGGKKLIPIEAANVNRALQKGAKEVRTYNFDELINGATGRTLSEREAVGYIQARRVVEKLYILKNKQVVDNLLANNIKMYDGAEGILPVRNYSDWQSANTAWKQVDSDSHHILVPDKGLTIKGLEFTEGLIPLKGKKGLSREMLQDAYDKGYMLVRNHSKSGLIRKGEVKTQWAFVKQKNVHSPRGQQVIHRIEGYMPKQRTGAFWFVKKNKKVGLSGAEDYKTLSTQAYSDTEEGAKAWKAQQTNPDEFEIVFDRQLTTDQRMYDVASTHGGMYSGARKSEELPFVGAGDAEFADSFEALQHYINHIGRQYPASLYRIGAEQRFIKMGESLGIKGRSIDDVLANAGKKFAKTTPEFRMLKGVHDQISFVNMIPTDEEMAMAARWKTLGQMFDKPLLAKVPGLKNAPKFFYQKAAKNSQPVDVIRGITFNHLLGMYNPAQLIVQYSGALVGLAIDPVGAPKHIAKQFGWTALDNMASDPLQQAKLIKWMKKEGLGDFADEYELWAKSGFRESVVQGNADYTSVFTKNLPYDAGILRKVTANHTLFYKMGELANTRMAFATAVSRYKKTHNVKHIDPDNAEALEEIGLWAEKFRLNMSRANQSELNKGWKAAPLQFQQIISKYFEKVLPQVIGGTDEFTSWEKARLLTIPTVATGVVGIPAGQFVATRILEMAGIDETELDEETTRAIKHGVIGWMNSEMLELNINFSERMTLGGDVIKNVWDGLSQGKATWQWLGASGNVLDRYWRNGQYLNEALDVTVLDNDDLTFTDLQALPAILLEAASDIPTVSRNMKQYYSHILSDNPQFIKEGKYMWDWETMNTKTAWLATMGFQPNEATDMYEINKEINDSPLSFSVWGDTDADIMLRIINTRLLTGNTVKESELYSKVIRSMLLKYGPREQMSLLTLMRDKTLKRKFDQNNLLYKFLLEAETRQQDGLNILNALIARKLSERENNGGI